MIVSWIINFKSIQHGDIMVRGRKYLVDPILPCVCTVSSRPSWGGGSCLQNFILFFFHLQGSPMSHSSHLLISLLLSIRIRVIGYFTHVRVELVEGKGQATRLSVSCTTLIHQLSSGTRKATVGLSRHFVKPHPGLAG